MPRLLLATNNPAKVREMRALLEPAGWTTLHPAGLGITLEVEEIGATYAANAALKAVAFAWAANLLALADDSGLEVAALNGRPGIHSARYGGPGTPPEEQIELLLGELEDVPEEHRGARFVCTVVIATPSGDTWTADGALAGRIALEPRGAGGFGYDPIFFLPELGCTVAELDEAEKNHISHRARAVQAALPILDRLLRGGEGL